MSRYVQMTTFDYLEGGQQEMTLDSNTVKSLENKGYTFITPLASDSSGNTAYRAVFEGKPCTVQIDSEGHIMFKHDDSRFYDYGGSV